MWQNIKDNQICTCKNVYRYVISLIIGYRWYGRHCTENPGEMHREGPERKDTRKLQFLCSLQMNKNICSIRGLDINQGIEVSMWIC